MTVAMKGLRIKPTYGQLIGVAGSDGLEHIKFPNRDATFLRNDFVSSQLDGEGVRVMQLQQEQAMKESLKDHLLKQASQATGVNISDLRNPSNAETQNIRINNMLRNTGTGDNDVNGIPTADYGFGNNDVNGIPTADYGFGEGNVNGRPISNTGFGDGNVNTTQYSNISDGVNTSAATADYAPRVDRHEQLTQEQQRQIEIRYQEILEGIRQEAFAALNQQEQARVQQQEQDRAQAEAAINQVHREAQGVINETGGAVNRERQERRRMEAEAKTTQQAEQKAKTNINEETNRRRNGNREPQSPDRARAKPKAKTGSSPRKPSPEKLGSVPPPPFPTEEPASGSQDNPESNHERKGKPGRPKKNTQQNNQGPPPVKTKQKPKSTPKRDTEKDESRSRTYWQKAKRGYSVDQLSKYGWK